MIRRIVKNTALHSLFKLGTDTNTLTAHKKSIVLINIVSLLHLISFLECIVIGYLFVPILVSKHAIIGYLVNISIISVVLYCQYLKKHFTAKVLITLNSFFSCIIFDTYILPDIGVEFYYIITIIISLYFFKKLWINLLFLSLILMMFFDVFLLKTNSTTHKLHFLIWFLILFFMIYFLIRINFNVEQKLRIQQKKLKELDNFKSHFLVNISHEIRTPLTIMKGYAKQINTKQLQKKDLQRLDIIQQQTEKIQHLVDSIIDINKIAENKLKINTQLIIVDLFIKKCFEDYKKLFEVKNITFHLVRDFDEDLCFHIDFDLFAKAFDNLLNNALKFTAKNGCVQLIAYTQKKQLLLTVVDNGIGVPQKDLDKIFNRFYQSSNHITRSEGTGIGLAFTQSIIQAHGFSIEVESAIKTFTKFTITIPQKYLVSKTTAQTEDKLTNVALEENITTSSKQSYKRQILLVEDHEDMRNYIQGILTDYNVRAVKDGKDALTLIKQEVFDVIITDYMMPVINGDVLVRSIKELGYKTPIIVLTASTDKKIKLNMLRLGIDAYLNKPFFEEELLLHVKKAYLAYDISKKTEAKITQEEKEKLDDFADSFNQNLRKYITENLQSPNLNIERIADHFNISKSTLNRKVKYLLGQTAQQIVMEVRFNQAIILKEQNPFITKKELANLVGISNPSVFFAKMQQRTGKNIF